MLGKYRLEREISRGGMGVVWAAFDTQLQRRVAIKLLLDLIGASSKLRERFELEARAIAQLGGRNVIQIYDYGISDQGAPYIVMELLEGEDLAVRLDRSGPLSPEVLLPILSQVAKALYAAHRVGIVHRDIKPANIFLIPDGPEVIVKVLDFGVASFRSEYADATMELTGENQLLGTPAYMSPEQADLEVVDYRSDLWSLAVVAYQALTGVRPFGGSRLQALFAKICSGVHELPSRLMSGVLGPEVDAFFERALAKNPSARFSSAIEMAAAFARLTLHESEGKPTKIMVIDDESDLQLLIEQCFQEQIDARRYEFLFAGNGEEALAQLADHPDVDIALTDLNMPRMDGLTFLERVKTAAPALRSIVISAFGDMGNIRRAMNAGAFDFVTKPLDFVDLEATVEKAAERVREVRKALRSIEENQALRMFVDPITIERLLPFVRASSAAGAERLDATIAVVSMRGVWTHIAGHDADQAVEFVNYNCELIAAAIMIQRGVVLRFLGDTLIAMFYGRGHRERALDACVGVRVDLARRAAESSCELEICAGVDTGSIVCGGIGVPSQHRFDYAALGESVQLARGLASVAERGDILISQALHDALETLFYCEASDEVVVRDSGEVTAAYKLLGRRTGNEATDDAICSLETEAPTDLQTGKYRNP